MNVTLNPNAAMDGASQIDKIVSDIDVAIQELDAVMKRNIPERVETTWSETVLSNWNRYYTGDVPAAMDAMKLSATNLRMAVDAVLKYSNEQQ